jgi:sec-independent protein translocase protein TatA
MTQPLFIGTVGVPELLIIGFILVLLFGGKKVPELMSGIGKGIKGLKDGIEEKE